MHPESYQKRNLSSVMDGRAAETEGGNSDNIYIAIYGAGALRWFTLIYYRLCKDTLSFLNRLRGGLHFLQESVYSESVNSEYSQERLSTM